MYSDPMSSAPFRSESHVTATESSRNVFQASSSIASARSMATRGCCTAGCLPDGGLSELAEAKNAACSV